MVVRLIQQKIPIGTKVKFTLKNGREISGILVEIGRAHISLENRNGTATILTELIGTWELLEKEVEKPDKEKLSETPAKKAAPDLDPEIY